MIFRKTKETATTSEDVLASDWRNSSPSLLIVTPEHIESSKINDAAINEAIPAWGIEKALSNAFPEVFSNSFSSVLAVFTGPELWSSALARLREVRRVRQDGYPTLIIAANTKQLRVLGQWLAEQAINDQLEGVRLILAENETQIWGQLASRVSAVSEPNIIKMPLTTEVETTQYKYFYTISPQLRRVVTFMRELAENGVTRLYLLGGPGSGKTSLAYYYWLCRGEGSFITVNLTAESTDDKAAMKSLLCGHVTGSFEGAQSREGALAFARDGVCFLDESHGVTGVVMQVLMEVLDSGQYLPFGGTKKRMLECAVILASNRNWEALLNQMHLDEYARLGTTIIQIDDLRFREEDLIAVLATSLSKFASQCNTWTAPQGVSPEAWQMLRDCPWRGNLRTLIRTVETAGISVASSKVGNDIIGEEQVRKALELWEPEQHPTADIYTSFGGEDGGG